MSGEMRHGETPQAFGPHTGPQLLASSHAHDRFSGKRSYAQSVILSQLSWQPGTPRNAAELGS
jgi:hypothetical protein